MDPIHNSKLSTIDLDNFEIGDLQELAEETKKYAQYAKSPNTKKAYLSDWEDFVFWCHSKRLNPIPAIPQAVAVYLVSRAKYEWVNKKGKKQLPLKISSLERRLTSINQAHKLMNRPFDKHHPELQEVWKGLKKHLGIVRKCKEPILIDDLRKMMEAILVEKNGSKRLIGIRDRSLLLIGFVGAFRRSEIVGLNIEDVKFTREGVVVNLRRSKTDQEGEGRLVAIPYGSNILTCPVRNLKDWIDHSGIKEGALFRGINRHGQLQEEALTDHAVAIIIKRNKYLANRKESFSGHSLRAGFVTTAVLADVSEHSIMRQTGHKKSDTLKKYIRIGNMWKENAASKIGL